MAVVGAAISAELIIKHSRAWDSSSSPPPDAPLEFYYEVQNNLEVWLVSGRKRAHFAAKEGDELRFPLLLVPLKAGGLLLPNVEVKQVGGGNMGEEGGGEVSCETDYRSHGETILVLPDVRSTTVRIDGPTWGEGVSPGIRG
jgi:trafficking protein particle complex subunit 10